MNNNIVLNSELIINKYYLKIAHFPLFFRWNLITASNRMRLCHF